MKKGLRPYQIIGAIDAYGACRTNVLFRESDGALSQRYPGHFEIWCNLHHKKWRWWVDEARLDGPELMHWTPDVEERDLIQRAVARELSFQPDIPRHSIIGAYPNWKQVYPPEK